MKRLLTLIAVFFAIGASWVANAETKRNVYSNKFVGITFSVPSGWYVATDHETKEMMPDAARVMGLDDPVAQQTVTQMPGKVLLMVSEHAFNSDINNFNRNILFAAINSRDMKGEVASGSDYLAHVARGMRENRPDATVSKIRNQRLGNREFHRLDVTLSIQGVTAHMSQWATIQNEYILILNMSAGSDSGLTGLVTITDNNIRLSSVPQATDRSPQGKTFRRQSSLNVN